MVHNCIEWCRMVPNGTEWYQMVTNGVKWYQLVPNGNKLYWMVPNDTKWCRMVLVPTGAEWYALMILSNLLKGGICRHSSNHSHGIRKIGNKLVKGKIVLDDESLTVTASRFVKFWKKQSVNAGLNLSLLVLTLRRALLRARTGSLPRWWSAPWRSSYFISVGFHSTENDVILIAKGSWTKLVSSPYVGLNQCLLFKFRTNNVQTQTKIVPNLDEK